MVQFGGLRHLLVVCVGAIGLASPALAQTDDNTRGVHIIEESPASSAPSTPSLTPPPALNPAPSAPIIAPAPPPAPGPAQATLAPARPDLGALQSSLKASNAAGLAVDILPRAELHVGEKIALRVTTKKQGYLILVDVDATGKLTQIYPNRRSLLTAQEGQESANLIKPGRPITIPDAANPFAGFEFVAEPPAGVAMVVAILSDRPVQMLDLPDVPSTLAGQGGALSYLSDYTHSLRIVRADASDRMQEASWSFYAKPYEIR